MAPHSCVSSRSSQPSPSASDHMAPVTMLTHLVNNLLHFSLDTGIAVSSLITVFIFGLGAMLLFANFFHLLNQKFAFFLSGTLVINLVAYLGIAIVYTHNSGESPIPIDGYTAGAGVMMLILLIILFGIIHIMEPSYKGSRRMRQKLKDLSENE